MKRIPGRFWMALLAAAALGARPAAAEDVKFPDTEPGRHAREFFAAYNADEATMRAFYAGNIAAEDLKARTPGQRLEVWRQLRGEQGQLTPMRVLGAGEDFVAVQARNARGEALTLRFHCRAEPPHPLVGIQVEASEDTGGPPAGAAPAGPPPTDAQIVAALAGQLDSLSRAGAFSGVAVLDKNGTALFARAYGMASREARRPNTLDTRFDLGSINKIFTTVAVYQLARQGRLGLDDPIARHLPDYPAEAAGKITVRMLLEHRAGVPDVLRSPELWKDPLQVRTAADWYRLVRDLPLEFEPGTRQQYSNGGFVLLGMIVQRVSGEDYYDYIRRHVYGPAGMAHTDHYEGDRLPEDVAVRYSRDGGEPAVGAGNAAGPQPVRVQLGRGSAAGGGHSTAGDLVRFARALRDHRLLDSTDTEALIGPGAGLGIAGGSPGVNALLELSGPYTLVVLANLDPPAAEVVGRGAGRLVRRAGGTGRPGGQVRRVGAGRP